MDPPPPELPDPEAVVKKKTELMLEQRTIMLHELLKASTNWTLPRGFMVELVTKFGVHRTTVLRLWTRACQSAMQDPEAPINILSRKSLTG